MFSSAYPLNKIDGFQKRICMMISTLPTDFSEIFLGVFFQRKSCFH